MEKKTKNQLLPTNNDKPKHKETKARIQNKVEKTYDVDDLTACAMKLSLGETENKMHGVTPSKYVESSWLRAKTSDQHYSRLNDKNGGKWLIFLDDVERDSQGLTTLDKAWSLIEQATLNGNFYQSKVSTALKEPYDFTKNTGVIVIYTKDCKDLDDVLKTAVKAYTLLQDLLPPKYFLRYKTNAATDAGLYPDQNCKNVTIYRYSKSSGLQQRDSNGWVTPPPLKSKVGASGQTPSLGSQFRAPGRFNRDSSCRTKNKS